MDELSPPEDPVIVEAELQNGRKVAPRRCRDWRHAAQWIASADFYLMDASSPVRSVTVRRTGPPPAQGGAR